MRRLRAALTAAIPMLALGCPPPRAPLAAPARCAFPDPVEPHEPGAEHRYLVSVAPRGEELCAEVTLPRGAHAEATWIVVPQLLPYLRDVAAARDRSWEPARASAEGFVIPACAGAACRVRYRVLLTEAARALHDRDYALPLRGVILSPASSWMLRPRGARAPFTLAFRAPAGTRALSGFTLAAPGSDTYEGDVARLDETPYAAFGPLAMTRAKVGGGEIDLAFTPGARSAAIDAWIDRALRAVAAYYGRFPADHAAIVFRLGRGHGVGDGHTMGNGGASVLIAVGEETTAAELADDWVLVHELVHLSFPDTGTRWAEEGLATYVEPIIRARAGITGADELWRGMIEGMPQGQPEDGDRGLDHTDTWGRRYWGGAIYWLVADMEIRKATRNVRSLDDALRAVNRAGGNVAAHWDLDRALSIGDEATGVPVLRALRARLGGAPERVDLDALWRSLGVSVRERRVSYDDAAPLAAIRRGIGGR